MLSRPSLDAEVVYHIVWSPSYQLPVLYFTFHRLPPNFSPSLETAYDILVPQIHESALRDGGTVMGALSRGVSRPKSRGADQQDHPLVGLPYFFIHPCNTASAMRELAKTVPISKENYLALWLGLVGPAVGLYIPSSVAV